MCVIFYIAHLGVRYEIYTLALPFDLRCQSGILRDIDYLVLKDISVTSPPIGGIL